MKTNERCCSKTRRHNMATLSIVTTLAIIYLGLSSILWIVGWIKAILLINKHGWIQAGRILVSKGDRGRGSILLIMGLGDRSFKIMTAIPLIGQLFCSISILWLIIKGGLTVKAFLIISLLQIIFGLLLVFCLKCGQSAIKSKMN